MECRRESCGILPPCRSRESLFIWGELLQLASESLHNPTGRLRIACQAYDVFHSSKRECECHSHCFLNQNRSYLFSSRRKEVPLLTAQCVGVLPVALRGRGCHVLEGFSDTFSRKAIAEMLSTPQRCVRGNISRTYSFNWLDYRR